MATILIFQSGFQKCMPFGFLTNDEERDHEDKYQAIQKILLSLKKRMKHVTSPHFFIYLLFFLLKRISQLVTPNSF